MYVLWYSIYQADTSHVRLHIDVGLPRSRLLHYDCNTPHYYACLTLDCSSVQVLKRCWRCFAYRHKSRFMYGCMYLRSWCLLCIYIWCRRHLWENGILSVRAVVYRRTYTRSKNTGFLLIEFCRRRTGRKWVPALSERVWNLSYLVMVLWLELTKPPHEETMKLKRRQFASTFEPWDRMYIHVRIVRIYRLRLWKHVAIHLNQSSKHIQKKPKHRSASVCSFTIRSATMNILYIF